MEWLVTCWALCNYLNKCWNIDLLSIGIFRINFTEIWIKLQNLPPRNAFQFVICNSESRNQIPQLIVLIQFPVLYDSLPDVIKLLGEKRDYITRGSFDMQWPAFVIVMFAHVPAPGDDQFHVNHIMQNKRCVVIIVFERNLASCNLLVA